MQRGTGEIDGIPPEVLRAFSTRRAEIEERLEILGDTSAAASRRAALETRRPKLDIDSETLHARWLRPSSGARLRPAATERGARPRGAARRSPSSTRADRRASRVGAGAHRRRLELRPQRRRPRHGRATRRPVSTPNSSKPTPTRSCAAADVVALASDTTTVRYSTLELLDTETRLVTTAVARQREGAGYCPPSRVNSVHPPVSDAVRRTSPTRRAPHDVGQRRRRRGRRGGDRQDVRARMRRVMCGNAAATACTAPRSPGAPRSNSNRPHTSRR